MRIDRLNMNFLHNLLGLLKLIVTTSPRLFIYLVALIIIQGGSPLALAWISKLLFDLLGQTLIDNLPVDFAMFGGLLLVSAVITILTAMAMPVNNLINADIGRKLSIKIQTKVYEKINAFAGIAYFEKPEIYDKLRLARDGARSSSIQTLQVISTLMQSTVNVVSFLGVLFIFDPLMMSVIFLMTLPELYLQMKFGHQRYNLSHKVSQDQRQQLFYTYILSSPQPTKEIRLFNLGDFLLKKALNHLGRVQTEERNQQVYELRRQTLISVLGGIVTGTLTFVIFYRAFQNQISLGDVTFYISAIVALQGGLAGLAKSLGGVNEGVLQYSYYRDLMALPEPLDIEYTPQPISDLKLGIEFRNVSFRYSDDHQWILRNVNLFIPSGKSLAIVGLNGAGKTTLVKLLTRLYDPTDGQILWDGIDIRHFAPADFRKKLSAVYQDFMKYDFSVAENIGVGNIEDIDNLDCIKQVAANVGIHQKIEQLPLGYQTCLSLMFGEHKSAIDFSGGEWQKIAIARMMMRDADLLILDEPTASLDTLSEREIYRNFMKIMPSKTSVLISHRFTTVEMADLIAVLDKNTIKEYGSHDELMRLNQLYAKLYTSAYASKPKPKTRNKV